MEVKHGRYIYMTIIFICKTTSDAILQVFDIQLVYM